MVALAATQGLTVIRRRAWLPPELDARLRSFNPRSGLGWVVRETIMRHRLPADAVAELLDAITRTVVIESSLAAVKIDGLTGLRLDYGIVGRKVVTTAGVNFIVDAFQNSVEIELLHFHGMGTGAVAAGTGDTALGTELTTEYNPNSTRATGTTVEGASANIYQTVGTNTIDSGTPAVTEHGVFSSATGGAGTLLDRTVFAAINLVGANSDGVQFTYELTCSAGG